MKEYEFRSQRNPDVVHKLALQAYWEVEGDPMSDDYTPQDISAEDLFRLWVQRYGSQCDRGLVPISWFVWGDRFKPEFYPYEFDHFAHHDFDREDFLTFYTQPGDARTRQPLNWLTLPVVDKLWRGDRGDKGGFIQEATGWKPSVLQPYVWLGSLTRRRGLRRRG